MRLVFCLVALLLLSACSAEKSGSKIFSDATEARLFINPTYIEIDKFGRPNAGTFPKYGILLSSKEMADIQKSVYHRLPKFNGMHCCIPRHSFLFYDKAGKYLGQVTVCFECDCIVFSGAKYLGDVGWDYEVFASIVKAHGQKTKFE